jgi:hypothetical protein
MENEEMLEQTNETENVETQTTEEMEEGISLEDDTNESLGSDGLDDASSNEDNGEQIKTFTQEEVDAIVQKRLARKERDFQKELSKYKSTEEVLKTGLGATDISDAEDKLREFYEEQGIKLPERVKPGLTEHQLELLAKDDAQEIIDSGDAEEEASKLAAKGWANMNQQERVIFNTLFDHINHEKQINELRSIGVKSDILDSKEFKDFASKFNTNTSIVDIYDLYSKSHKESKTAEKMGSMKSTSTQDNGVKDFYSREEALKFTKEDLDKNPDLYKAIERSMQKW